MDKKNKKKEEPKIYAVNNRNGAISRKEFVGALGALTAGAAMMPTNVFAEKIKNSGDKLDAFKAHKENVQSVCFSPDGNVLASAGESTVKIWSIPEGKLFKTINGRSIVRFSPDGKTLAFVGDDSNIKLYSVAEGKIITTLSGFKGFVGTISFSPSGKVLASAGTGSVITLWAIPEGRIIASLKGHSSTVNTIDFSLDGETLASGSDDKTVKLWSVPKRRLIKTLRHHKKDVYALGFSPNGKTLVSASADKTFKIWSLPTGKLLESNSYNQINTICFSPDGKNLILGTEGHGYPGAVGIWSLNEKKLITTFREHKKSINSVCISPFGEWLASGSNDKTIKLLTMPGGKPGFTLFDPALTEKTETMKVKQMGPITKTVPCGTPIPVGSTCICNCVASSRTYPGTETVCTCNTITVPAGTTLSGNYTCVCNTIVVGTVCSCDTICTCNSVCSCNNHQSTNTYYYTTTYWYPN